MPTQTQDPTDTYTLRIEMLRRLPRPRGLAGLVHDMFLNFFVRLLTLLATIAKQRPTGPLPDPAPAPQPAASPRPTAPPDQPRLPPPDPRPWQSGRPQHRRPETASGGTMHAPSEPPEPPPEITQPIAEPPQLDPIVPPPRRARLRKLKHPSGPTPARPQPEDNGCWPRRRGADLLCTRDAPFLRFDSKKWLQAAGPNCVHFVTY